MVLEVALAEKVVGARRNGVIRTVEVVDVLCHPTVVELSWCSLLQIERPSSMSSSCDITGNSLGEACACTGRLKAG